MIEAQFSLHAAFQILVDLVEQEKPDEVCDWQHDELHRNAWNEISQLYKRYSNKE